MLLFSINSKKKMRALISRASMFPERSVIILPQWPRGVGGICITANIYIGGVFFFVFLPFSVMHVGFYVDVLE